MKRSTQGVLFTGVALSMMGALLFISAGTIHVVTFWIYLALWTVYLAVTGIGMERLHPDLVDERMRPPSDRDPNTRKLAALPLLGHFVLAGLSIRYGWWPLGLGVQALGLVLLSAGMFFVSWTLQTNRFASSAVRVQTERSHTVVEHGPYAMVRHPMYLGTILVCFGSGAMLGSGWAVVMLLPIIPLFIRRTLFEDRMLLRELPGYPDYARKTRFRLIPAVW